MADIPNPVMPIAPIDAEELRACAPDAKIYLPTGEMGTTNNGPSPTSTRSESEKQRVESPREDDVNSLVRRLTRTARPAGSQVLFQWVGQLGKSVKYRELDIYPHEREVVVIGQDLEVQRWKQ